MIKLLISFFLAFILFSCDNIDNKEIISKVKETKNQIQEKIKLKKNESSESKNQSIKKNNIFYYLGEIYYIEGVEYIPTEDYNYNEVGLSSFYGKELHNVKTINNDFNKVTELLGRHKTLPVPSIVKITNLENGLSITIKIVDRHNDNAVLIQVSRKVAQLLGFYKNKFAKVRVEIISDASKQWKNVANSMNEPSFDKTVSAAPTNKVSIANIDEDNSVPINNSLLEQPVELSSENVENLNLFLKIYNFKDFEDIQIILKELNIEMEYTSEKIDSSFNLIIGPINNEDANKLVSSFISKGYKKTEIILK